MRKFIFSFILVSLFCFNCYAQTAQEQPNIPEKLKGKTTEEIVKLGENHIAVRQYIMLNGEKIILSKQETGFGGIMETLFKHEKELANWKDPQWVNARIAEFEAFKAKLLIMKQKLEDPNEPIVENK